MVIVELVITWNSFLTAHDIVEIKRVYAPLKIPDSSTLNILIFIVLRF